MNYKDVRKLQQLFTNEKELHWDQKTGLRPKDQISGNTKNHYLPSREGP